MSGLEDLCGVLSGKFTWYSHKIIPHINLKEDCVDVLRFAVIKLSKKKNTTD